VTITLDMSIPEFFGRISPFFINIYDLWRERIDEWLAERQPDRQAPPVQMGGYDPAPGQASASQAEMPGEASDTVEWYLPPVDAILDSGAVPTMNEDFVTQRALLIEETLEAFGAPVNIVEINRGPTITQFGVEPGYLQTRKGQTRVRVNKITSLADDLALALAASRIRIQAPVPGKGYIGIEVPNEETAMVALRDIIESESFNADKTPLGFALGRDVAGYPQVADLTKMPHLLIAGTTGSGKSVCINSILTSMLLHNTPDELRFVLVDPKRVELTNYNGIPHLLAPVVVDTDKVIGALQWMTREMDKRYHEFAQLGVRNISEYNARIETKGGKRYPYLVIVIDELADLMMIAPTETESTITRLAQLARATGIHMILATQRPSVDVVTGLIKANFPARIAFAVASGTDSRVILDQPGAERLLGRGDMLYQAPDAPAAARLQGVYISDIETARLVDFWRVQAGQPSAFAPGDVEFESPPPQGVPLKQVEMFEEEILNAAKKIDPLFDEAVDIVRRQGRASVSMLQRKLRIGYTRASRLVDAMEDEGIVGPPTGGTGVRDVLDYGKAAPPVG
jgi:S-DNA-T family DNA segregation ATPase FtsK/SpoIIIE